MTKRDVEKFWSSQAWDLGLNSRTNLTNCTFCFLKGSSALLEVTTELMSSPLSNELAMTPMDINWWAYLEETYGRDLIKEERIRTNDKANLSFIGFFGENAKFSYKALTKITDRKFSDEIFFENETEVLACNCTD